MRGLLALGVAAMAGAGCHVTVRTEVGEAVATRSEPHLETARPVPPTVALADGALRFVEPLMCRSDEIVELAPEIQRARKPNLATFVVGLVATVGGAIAGVSALAGDDAGGNPLTYAGAAGVAVGVPLAVGPWIGNHTAREPAPHRTERRPGPEVACGSRPIAGGFALVTVGARQVYGPLGEDGALGVSPFTWIDAFDEGGGPAFAVHAEIRGRAAPRTVDKVFEAGALAPWREAFLASTHLDVRVEPLRAVPQITAGAIRIGHVLIGSQVSLHVVLPLTNAGPGDAWQVRAVIGAASPELDGRIIYIGRVPARGTATGELWLPISPEADDAVRRTTLDLGFRLVDAHQTMPSASLVFRGTVEDDGFQ